MLFSIKYGEMYVAGLTTPSKLAQTKTPKQYYYGGEMIGLILQNEPTGYATQSMAKTVNGIADLIRFGDISNKKIEVESYE